MKKFKNGLISLRKKIKNNYSEEFLKWLNHSNIPKELENKVIRTVTIITVIPVIIFIVII